MADVQLEHGFTRFADALLEALIRTRMPAQHLQLMLAIGRLTYGWGRKRDHIGSGQLARMLEIDDSRARRLLRDLQAWGLVTVHGSRGRRASVGIVKDHDLWRVGETADAKRRRGLSPARAGGNPGGVPRDPGGVPPGNPGGVPPDSRDKRDTLPERGAGDAGKRAPRGTERGRTAAPENARALPSLEQGALRHWCRQKHGDLWAELEALVDACFDHHRARDHRFKDWSAVARNWVRKEAQMRAERAKSRDPLHGEADRRYGKPRRRDRRSEGHTESSGVIDLTSRIGRWID